MRWEKFWFHLITLAIITIVAVFVYTTYINITEGYVEGVVIEKNFCPGYITSSGGDASMPIYNPATWWVTVEGERRKSHRQDTQAIPVDQLTYVNIKIGDHFP